MKIVSQDQKLMLLAFYAPYLIIPLLLTFYMAANSQPFGEKKKTK